MPGTHPCLHWAAPGQSPSQAGSTVVTCLSYPAPWQHRQSDPEPVKPLWAAVTKCCHILSPHSALLQVLQG